MNSAWWKQFENQSIDHSYVLRGLIGIGAFGVVFRADHRIEDVFVREVAVKLISSDPEHIRRQLQEFVLATALRHPHLLECFHAGSTVLQYAKLLYLVMELGEYSLEVRLKSGLLTVTEARQLALELASGLDYLHRRKRVHRDVKPANVLRIGDGWKLSDFGTIRQSGTLTTSHTNVVAGTMMYMPPESFEGVVSPAWDIWSLGVLLIQVLTGEDPYPQTSQHELMWAITQKDPQIPNNIAHPFLDIILGCLKRDHHARWSAIQVIDVLTGSISVEAADPQGSDDRVTARFEKEVPQQLWRSEHVVADTRAQVTRLQQENRFEAAEEVIRTALQLCPTDERLTNLYAELNRAREVYARSEEIKAAILKTDLMLDAGQVERAVLQLERLAEQYRGDASVLDALDRARARNPERSELFGSLSPVGTRRMWMLGTLGVGLVVILGLVISLSRQKNEPTHISGQGTNTLPTTGQTVSASYPQAGSAVVKSSPTLPPASTPLATQSVSKNRAERIKPGSTVSPMNDLVKASKGSGVISASPNPAVSLNGDSMNTVLEKPPHAPPQSSPPSEEPGEKSGPQRIRIGGNVQAANLIRKVTPVYPPLAKQARIEGPVRFIAIIGKDGTVQNLQFVSGHPFLIESARRAVIQWRYKPVRLNGQPVEVLTQIDVNFTLSAP